MTGHPGYRLIQVSYPVAILRRQIDGTRRRNRSGCGGQASVRWMLRCSLPSWLVLGIAPSAASYSATAARFKELSTRPDSWGQTGVPATTTQDGLKASNLDFAVACVPPWSMLRKQCLLAPTTRPRTLGARHARLMASCGIIDVVTTSAICVNGGISRHVRERPSTVGLRFRVALRGFSSGSMRTPNC